MKIMKFGGTSVGKPERMHQVSQLITKESEPTIVVLSALSGTTNSLVGISDALAKLDKQGAITIIDTLEKHYRSFIIDLLKSDELRAKANAIIDEHFEFLKITQRISLSDALNKDILAQGELMSTKLFSLYLDQEHIEHALIPALEFMRLDANEEPDLLTIREKLQLTLAAHPTKKLFITQGYICRNAKGEVDNLKRGGSDYTASLVAAAVKASVCEIWTDIDGMHNNDPRVVDKTVAIEQLSFDEAAELAYFGAKILHPTCIWPAQQENIPVKLLNTMQPSAAGTVIKKEAGTVGVKAVAAKDGIIAVKIKSSRMLLAYGFLRKIFEVFEKYKTPIDMITTSEVAVSVTIDSDLHLAEIVAELSNIASVEIEKEQTIVSIVGNEIAQTSSVLKKLFDAIDEVPVTMVSYGGSPHNITLLLPSVHKTKTLQLINKGLFNL
ncbi:MAG: aspartate kinase [Sediminibacterium sp.]|jgi:aspartate kinase|nr:aspartate kinase [Sediminibacterium sp.]